MINLTGKNVFVKTQEEYLSVLKIARFQGFIWARENHLNPIEIPFPNILNFYNGKNVTYREVEKTLYEASEIVEDEEKIKDAVNLVRAFAKNPDRTALTDSFIKSLKLLADTVESQMEEVKQMIKKILYTCQICNTNYADKERAIACEKSHKSLEGAAFVGEYKPKGMVGDGHPIKIRVKFKGSDKWVVYKR